MTIPTPPGTPYSLSTEEEAQRAAAAAAVSRFPGWQNLALAAGVEAPGVAQCRLHSDGRLEFRGSLKIEAGKAVKAKELLARIPAAFRITNISGPISAASTAKAPAEGTQLLVELDTGQLTLNVELAEGETVGLYGIAVPVF